MHLDPFFGETEKVIELDGFPITRRIPMLDSSDSPAGIARAIGRGQLGFADAFEDLSPDMVLLLGDRFELLSAATSALVMRIPIGHIHGGEVTERAYDEAIRHAITKMSSIHFVAADPYRARVIQLGENPTSVHLVGGLGVDFIRSTQLLEREDVQERLDVEIRDRSLLVTFHPVTLDPVSSTSQLRQLLIALSKLHDTTILMTRPNADTQGRRLSGMIDDFAENRPDVHIFASLGNPLYASCMKIVDAVVGNSSSGLLEAPSLKTPTVNIGGRQKGRLCASSVINSDPDHESIQSAINLAFSPEFRARLDKVRNPYGDGGASEKIVRILEQFDFRDMDIKTFYDLPGGPNDHAL